MGNVYDSHFFENIALGSLTSARAVAPFVLDHLSPSPPTSVADLGCGSGTWLKAFMELGVEDVVGIDGDYVDQSLLSIPQDRFHPHDLEKPFSIDRQFDLAISLEVAEHLSSGVAPNFVGSLVRLAPVILFSAAIPCQGGHNHVNEQWPSYWERLFAKHQYKAVDVRDALWDDDRIDAFYRQNILFFVRNDLVETFPMLKRRRDQMSGAVKSLVHPGVLQYWIDWGMEQSKAYWALKAQKNSAQ